MSESSDQAPERIVEFLRKRPYVLVKELGRGACGQTVLLRDDILDQLLVCKKYSPREEPMRKELFASFLREIKLLHLLHHPNVVRFFNCYVYPDLLAGYILLEYVDGRHVDEYVRAHPERINETFLQAIEAFAYLEKNKVLHRDIRPANVMVAADGTIKVIDLGFGKRVAQDQDFDKSISLNWWCEPPEEFANGRYDFRTEVYFVGKLFEKLIHERGLEEFKYRELLRGMCQWRTDERIKTFGEVIAGIQKDPFYEIHFSEDELTAYREFVEALADHITKISSDAKYVDDIDRIASSLEAAYQATMLAETAPDCVPILRAVLEGAYYYRKTGFPVAVVREFLRLLKSVSVEKQRIIATNMRARLDAIKRYAPSPEAFDDDIPF